MDRRFLLLGLLMTGAGTAGSILLSIALSLSVIGSLGLLLIIISLLSGLWYLDARIRQLEDLTQYSTRQVRRAVEVHATTMARRYDTTMEQMEEMNNELVRRIYR